MDEFEHVHSAWMVHSGFVPYQDFWQNHTPLLHYLFAPAFDFMKEGIPLIFLFRTILSASALFILWMTYLLARQVLDRQTSILSVLVLSFAVLFVQKTIEIRPDQFLVISWLVSLWMIIRCADKNQKSLQMLIAGVVLGLGMLFSPKALLCFAAVLFTFGVNWLLVNRWKGFSQSLKMSALYAVGFGIPFAICSAVFYQIGALRLFIDSTIFNNLNFPRGRTALYLLSFQHLVFFLLSSTGTFLWFRDRDRQRQTDLWIALPCLFLLIIFLFVMPTASHQSALLFVPLLSIYSGIAFKKAIEMNRKRDVLFLSLAILAGVIVPCVSVLLEQPSTVSNHKQLHLIRGVLNQTRREDVFFDGSCSYVFRRQAYYYGSMPDGIIWAIERGKIRESIPQSLINNQCKFVVYDDRLPRLPDSIQNFLRNNYIPSNIPDILIAGKHLDSESFSGKKARFSIDIPLPYSIEVIDSDDFHVDGKRYRGPVFLTAGAHEVIADGVLKKIVIRAD